MARGRYKTPKYKKWESECETYQNDIFTYRPEPKKALEVSYKFYSQWFNKGDKKVKIKDLSNYLKCLEDYLPNIIKDFDDKYIWKYKNIEKVHSGRNEVEILMEEINI